MSNNLKGIVMGIGDAGYLHAEAINRTKGLEFVAFADPNDSAVQKAVEEVPSIKGAQRYNSFDEMLEKHKGFDFIVNALPIPLHLPAIKHIAKINSQRYDEGKIPHILFTEKPLAATYIDALEIEKLVKNSKTRIMVGLTGYFHPEFVEAKKALDEGKIGDLISMSERINFGGEYFRRYTTFNHSRRGVALEDGIHTMDRYEQMTGGRITSVNVNNLGIYFLKEDLDDFFDAVVTINLGNRKLHAPLTMRFASWDEEDYVTELLGTKGKILIRGFKDATLHQPKKEPDLLQTRDLNAPFLERFLPGFAAQMNAFEKFARGDKKTYLLEEALRGQAAVELAYTDAKDKGIYEEKRDPAERPKGFEK